MKPVESAGVHSSTSWLHVPTLTVSGPQKQAGSTQPFTTILSAGNIPVLHCTPNRLSPANFTGQIVRLQRMPSRASLVKNVCAISLYIVSVAK